MLPINLLARNIKVGWAADTHLGEMAPSEKASVEMLHRIADAVLETVLEAPEGASERAMLWSFETRGVSTKTFYGVIAALEEAGFVRWRGNQLFPALLN